MIIEANFKNIEPSTPFIDSHCHIDLMSKRIENFTIFPDFLKTNQGTFAQNYAVCVVVFSYPKDWSSPNFADDVLEPLLKLGNMWPIIGCHPRDAFSFNKFKSQKLQNLLSGKRIKAVGKMGLDYSLLCFRNSNYIGLTPAVTNFLKYPTLKNVMKEIPLNKLLIETDAPYYTQTCLNINWNANSIETLKFTNPRNESLLDPQPLQDVPGLCITKITNVRFYRNDKYSKDNASFSVNLNNLYHYNDIDTRSNDKQTNHVPNNERTDY
ncbi:hypothetical protein HELRODRAFT_181505 [Helobdella robusta]|uniref:Uncharacterized protein n=1 Tax=Helobdella robusta TaxID=6412 RepID=T1FH25_HELRO|nr:hypothetical protein HELRODRAFT_181505 [Helobdella robusta]ESN92310.1 hypothetical protein HELRODRAFT_181505 [Helobdella robusta]